MQLNINNEELRNVIDLKNYKNNETTFKLNWESASKSHEEILESEEEV